MTAKEAQNLTFLQNGGEMGEWMRTKDWSKTSVGTPENWPQSLRTSINILLNSQFPMFIWWGEELITFYNDAYRVIAGEKHPTLLGQSGKEGWVEIWPYLAPLVQSVFNGVSTWSEDQVLYVNRRGFIEEAYFTFSYSPIMTESGEIGGLFCACFESTEKVQATRRIQESERNLRNTILQSPVAMCILKGPSFVVEIANGPMYELWGRESGDVLNRPIFDGLPEARHQGLEELLLHVYNTGEAFIASERPVQLPRKNGIETVFLNFTYQPFYDVNGGIVGVLAVGIDVTEQVVARKRIEQSEQELQERVKERTLELENQKNLLNNILVNSSNGITVTEMIRDENGKIVDANTILANEAAVQFTGLPREVFLSKTATELDPHIMESEYGKTCLKTLETGEPTIIQYYLDITGRWLELTLSKMDDNHLIHIFTDVTLIKQSQLQLESTVKELKRSNTHLEEFAHAASHDMKEPIRKIRTFIDRLQRKLEPRLDDAEKSLFDRIDASAERMQTLVDDLLDFSHVSQQGQHLELVNLNVKVEKVLADLEVPIEEKAAQITVGSLPTVKGNRRQLQQLFQNLISNALKYSKPDITPEITITSQTIIGNEAPIPLTEEKAKQTFHLIEVKDNGIGFEPQYAERIFEMFQRLHGKAEYAGTGVGLSIARKVVENHGGYIWATSEYGHGATFHILLPSNQL